MGYFARVVQPAQTEQREREEVFIAKPENWNVPRDEWSQFFQLWLLLIAAFAVLANAPASREFFTWPMAAGLMSLAVVYLSISLAITRWNHKGSINVIAATFWVFGAIALSTILGWAKAPRPLVVAVWSLWPVVYIGSAVWVTRPGKRKGSGANAPDPLESASLTSD